MNVALYGAHRRWCMTERGQNQLSRDAATLRIGPSTMAWRGGELVVTIREIALPLPRRVVGEIILRPKISGRSQPAIELAPGHFWQPLAPLAEISVQLEQPALSWSGLGYLDHNRGNGPLERSFLDWTWSRAALPDRARITYAGRRIDGSRFGFGLDFIGSGPPERFEPPPDAPLPRGFWGMNRAIPADAGSTPKLLETLEDAPFYARSLIETSMLGTRAAAMQESLSLTRFAQPLVQAMLPFKMPRRG